jgi:hypothetical protein
MAVIQKEIEGTVNIGVMELIDWNFEDVLDEFSMKLTGSVALMDINFEPVGLNTATQEVIFKVSGVVELDDEDGVDAETSAKDKENGII